MDYNIKKRINLIQTENNIWILYIIIIFFSFYANQKEKEFFLTNNQECKKTYRMINTIIFIILIGVYAYYEKEAISSFTSNNKNFKQHDLDLLSLIATTAVLISGIIFLYIIIVDKELEQEIAFN